MHGRGGATLKDDRHVSLHVPRVDEARLFKDLQSLVSIPSVSGTEGQLGTWLARTLRNRNLQVRIQRVVQGRFNVIARLRMGPGGKHLMLNGHLDTLPLQSGWTCRPYRAMRRGGRVYGSEVNNMKAALAAYLETLRLLAVLRPVSRGEVVLTAVMGECDTLGLGTLSLLESGFRADGAILGEPTDLNVLTAHSGVTQLRMIALGTAAHVSHPSAKHNAIMDMSRLVSGIDTRILHFKSHPAFPGLPTINVGVIRGGTAASMSADRCEALVDVRTVPSMTPSSVRDDLMRYIREVRRTAPALTVKVELRKRPEFCQQYPFHIDATAGIVEAVRQAADQVRGRTMSVGSWSPCVFYGTDGSHLLRGGIPVAVCGPGTAAQVSRPDEHIAWNDIVTAAQIYYVAAARFLGGVGGP
jgi:acetylornithine deacetylase